MGALLCCCAQDEASRQAKASLNPGAGSYQKANSSYGATSDYKPATNGHGNPKISIQKQKQRDKAASAYEAREKAGAAAQQRHNSTTAGKTKKDKKRKMIKEIDEIERRQAENDAIKQKRIDAGKSAS